MHVDDRLATVRSAYDTVAESYARLLPDASFETPADRGMIEAFAGYVKEGNAGPVLDAGCGAGRMTGLLSRLGIDVSGIDVSAGMVEVARRTYPGLGFEVAEPGRFPLRICTWAEFSPGTPSSIWPRAISRECSPSSSGSSRPEAMQ